VAEVRHSCIQCKKVLELFPPSLRGGASWPIMTTMKVVPVGGFMWIDGEASSPSEAKLAVGPLYRASSVLLPSPSFITFSGAILYDSCDSKLSHPPSLYIYLPFPALGTSSLYAIRCSEPRFTA
jgi:hypothetical protein